MTDLVRELLTACIVAKSPHDFVLTPNNKPVCDFRELGSKPVRLPVCRRCCFKICDDAQQEIWYGTATSEVVAMRVNDHLDEVGLRQILHCGQRNRLARSSKEAGNAECKQAYPSWAGFGQGCIGRKGYPKVGSAGFTSRQLVVIECVKSWCREGESNPQDPKIGGF